MQQAAPKTDLRYAIAMSSMRSNHAGCLLINTASPLENDMLLFTPKIDSTRHLYPTPQIVCFNE
jgi:hypothetical protein